ncbi:MAG: hypothetical protein WC716_08770 [Chitinophagaceae bacterium]|jgi:hypothetical protein
MKYLLTLLSIGLSLSLSAQKSKIHTSAELLKIAVDSKLSYSVSIMEKPIPPENYEDKLVMPDYYRVHEGESIIVKKYNINAKAKAMFESAEADFQANKFTEAREKYLMAYADDTTLSLALTYAGQVAEHSANYVDAESLLKRSVRQNYADYMAHWFLANVYEHNGVIKKAKEEILIAHILNRNNPRIISALKRIILKEGFSYHDDWQFNPQIMVQKTDSGINVQYGGIWLGYALARAIWQFEPGYRESMGVAKDADLSYNQDREKEGLLGVLVAAKSDAGKKLPKDVLALQSATEKGMFQEYLFYEIWLPKRPEIALQLPAKFIDEIGTYILKVRCSTN